MIFLYAKKCQEQSLKIMLICILCYEEQVDIYLLGLCNHVGYENMALNSKIWNGHGRSVCIFNSTTVGVGRKICRMFQQYKYLSKIIGFLTCRKTEYLKNLSLLGLYSSGHVVFNNNYHSSHPHVCELKIIGFLTCRKTEYYLKNLSLFALYSSGHVR
jgi:hypothetical protein